MVRSRLGETAGSALKIELKLKKREPVIPEKVDELKNKTPILQRVGEFILPIY